MKEMFAGCQKNSVALALFGLEAGSLTSGRKDLLTSFAQRLGNLSFGVLENGLRMLVLAPHLAL